MAHKVKVRVTSIRQRVIQSREPVQWFRCQSCQRQVEMVTDAEAARVLAVDQQGLAGLIGDGSVHAIQSVSGNTWVCKESLFPAVKPHKDFHIEHQPISMKGNHNEED